MAGTNAFVDRGDTALAATRMMSRGRPASRERATPGVLVRHRRPHAPWRTRPCRAPTRTGSTVSCPGTRHPSLNADHLGPWSPLPVAAVREVFRTARFRWFIAGGHALELALGSSWRRHDDLDVGVCRKDLDLVHRHLSDWDLHVAARGVHSRWDGRQLSEDRHENNVWARRSAARPWAFDIVVGGGDEDAWWSRRDPSVRLPWADAIQGDAGTPYLAPHVQLLMKSKTVRPKDELDARVVIPALSGPHRSWLAEHLPPAHPWQWMVRSSGSIE
jgi:hypothetical protein